MVSDASLILDFKSFYFCILHFLVSPDNVQYCYYCRVDEMSINFARKSINFFPVKRTARPSFGKHFSKIVGSEN